jgi:beta-lactamase superfamily II metal-dependent hydrolase
MAARLLRGEPRYTLALAEPPRQVAAMLFLVHAALLALPQGPAGDEAPPQGLTVVLVNVGQGDGAVIRAPDGTIHVVDAGVSGQGTAAVLPAIQALGGSSYGFTFASHYHPDHIGGLDEVLAARPFTRAWDRGDANRLTGADVTNYLNAAGARRAAVVDGQVLELGGGARVTVVAVNGKVWNGPQVPVVGTAQEENSRCVALRLEYRSFSMWLGGDLTGGASGTADVESPATLACGDVDVYRVNHHGSNTSTNVNLVTRLAPELALFSCGSNNPYGHPTTQTLNRLNQAAAARVLLATTEGTGAIGFGVGGNVTLTTDGTRYRATAQNGRFLDFYVDEVADATPAAGDVRISELHRQPSASPQNGEWLELQNVAAAPVSLRNVSIQSRTGAFTIVTNLMLLPGRPVVLGRDGWAARNGGLPLGVTWPFQALELGDAGDALVVRHGTATLDALTYASPFAGGAGVAAERRDLLAGTAPGGFVAAATAYGAGDRGTPGARNAADATAHPARVAVRAGSGALALHAAALAHPGKVGVVALAFSDQPGFAFLDGFVPLAPDGLFVLSVGLPGFADSVPAEGYRSLRVALPQPNPFAGSPGYAAHVVVDAGRGSVPAVSGAVRFVFP